MDDEDAWFMNIAKELKRAGYVVDVNALFD